jgi:hypothetical protein
VVWKDILAFIRDPAGPLPSDPPPIPRKVPRPPKPDPSTRVAAGL